MSGYCGRQEATIFCKRERLKSLQKVPRTSKKWRSGPPRETLSCPNGNTGCIIGVCPACGAKFARSSSSRARMLRTLNFASRLRASGESQRRGRFPADQRDRCLLNRRGRRAGAVPRVVRWCPRNLPVRRRGIGLLAVRFCAARRLLCASAKRAVRSDVMDREPGEDIAREPIGMRRELLEQPFEAFTLTVEGGRREGQGCSCRQWKDQLSQRQ